MKKWILAAFVAVMALIGFLTTCCNRHETKHNKEWTYSDSVQFAHLLKASLPAVQCELDKMYSIEQVTTYKEEVRSRHEIDKVLLSMPKDVLEECAHVVIQTKGSCRPIDIIREYKQYYHVYDNLRSRDENDDNDDSDITPEKEKPDSKLPSHRSDSTEIDYSIIGPEV